MRISNKLLGDAGEHYVAFQLARMGISPAMLSVNSTGVDILATDNGKNVISIQVKASSGRNAPRNWDVGKHQPAANSHFFYVFLNLWDDSQREIECFVVPSKYVFNTVDWKQSRPQFRLSRANEGEFLNKWEFISDLFKEEIIETQTNEK